MPATMTISREPLSAVYSRTTPPLFCEKKYKFIHIATDSASKVCLALFYKIISLAIWIVSAKKSHYYDSLSLFKCHQATRLLTYLMHGRYVVDFSINSSTYVKELLPTGMSEEDALKSIYGSENFDHWTRLGTSDIQLNKAALSRKEMGTDGCCFGMSLDFISSYLRQIRSGKSSLEAIKSIAPHYADGASDRAQLAQIFYEAFNLDSEKIARMSASRIYRERLDEIQKWAHSEVDRAGDLAPEEGLKLLSILRTQFEKRCEEAHLFLAYTCAEAALQHHQIIANTFDLTLQKPSIYLNKNNANHRRKNLDFEIFINHLPQGAYKVSLANDSKKAVAHAIAFIKTAEGQHFIYDPNRATFAVDSSVSGARLYEIIRWGSMKNLLRCEFTPCSLR